MTITKFKLISFILILSSLCSSSVFAQNYSGGSGTHTDPYQIANKADLKYLSEDSTGWALDYIQTADIVFVASDFEASGDFYYGGNGFLPIALGSSFTGTYDGKNHLIEGLQINRSSQSKLGLFSELNGASIANIGLSKVTVVGDSILGGLVGTTNANSGIYTCFTTGSISGNSYIGGLIGSENNGSIYNCYSSAMSIGTSSVGGFAGSLNATTITNSYSSGEVSGSTGTGGFCGLYATVTMTNSFWNIETSKQGVGSGGLSINGLQGINNDNMLNETTFTAMTWDFLGETSNGTSDVWKMDCFLNNGFPLFSWQSFTYTSNVIFVDSSAVIGLNNGTSWANAFTNLGDAFALANCVSVDSIYVAKGSYIPNRSQYNPTNKLEDRLENSFVLINHTVVFGGFPNGGGLRDYKLNETILSGNQIAAHVVVAAGNDSTAVLDGFTVMNGGSDTYLSGMVNGYEVFDCSGGGMYASVARPTIKNTRFINNEVGESGGGYFGYQSSPYFDNVSFIGNKAKNGGGMANQDKCSPVLFNAYFASNWAEDNGGAMYNVDTCEVYVNGAYIIGNSSDNYGGGVSNTDSSIILLVNTQLTGNTAMNAGGGAYNSTEANLSLLNTTVSGNSSAMGGGTYSTDGVFQIVNTIILGNTNEQVVSVNEVPLIVLSLIGNSFEPGNLNGIGLSPEDVFMDYADTTLAPSLQGNYGLKYGSIAIDAGYDYSDTFKVDILGNPRFLGKAMDLGAFESFYCYMTSSITNQSNVSCYGKMDGSITITQDSGRASFDYHWSNGDSTINTLANSSTIDSLSAGTYVLEIEDAYGCIVTDSVIITEPSAIDTSTSLNGFVISANATNANYQWIDCSNDSLLTGETSQSFSPAKNGSYAVIITEGNCSDTSACVSILNMSVSNKFNESSVSVYPNPTNGKFTVQLPSEENATIVVYNSLGQQISVLQGNAKEFELAINEVPGIYTIKISTATISQTMILVKE